MPTTPPRTRAPLTAASGREAGPSLHPPHRPHPAGERLCPRGTQVGAPPAAGQAARTLACLALAPTPPPLPPWSSGAPSPGPLLGLQPPRAASTVPSAAPPAFREARSPARGRPGGSQSISVQRSGPGPPRPPGSPSPSRPRTHGAALSPPSPRRTRALHRQLGSRPRPRPRWPQPGAPAAERGPECVVKRPGSQVLPRPLSSVQRPSQTLCSTSAGSLPILSAQVHGTQSGHSVPEAHPRCSLCHHVPPSSVTAEHGSTAWPGPTRDPLTCGWTGLSPQRGHCGEDPVLCTCLFESPLSRLGGRAQEGCRLRRQPHGQPALSQGTRTAARAALWSFWLRSSLPLRTLTRGGAPATVSPRLGRLKSSPPAATPPLG
ncbi:nascent polypeptide-associated complex subunit alpha, muscle-specific form-like [Sus scrofa]|uniref:nascent polypeptide-associated complex subunit alpha, muscle-specific form-like n=1 Tax=Sus scrofa TaxID=9823 RepID=UPI000A2B1E79|nr:nascent polypeptide-associated complex subunit alpha, muscle-specific form-like [Sus scrofa]